MSSDVSSTTSPISRRTRSGNVICSLEVTRVRRRRRPAPRDNTPAPAADEVFEEEPPADLDLTDGVEPAMDVVEPGTTEPEQEDMVPPPPDENPAEEERPNNIVTDEVSANGEQRDATENDELADDSPVVVDLTNEPPLPFDGMTTAQRRRKRRMERTRQAALSAPRDHSVETIISTDTPEVVRSVARVDRTAVVGNRENLLDTDTSDDDLFGPIRSNRPNIPGRRQTTDTAVASAVPSSISSRIMDEDDSPIVVLSVVSPFAKQVRAEKRKKTENGQSHSRGACAIISPPVSQSSAGPSTSYASSSNDVIVTPNPARKPATPQFTSPDEPPTCPICLETYKYLKKRNTELVSTVCGHIFCHPCLKKAMQQNSSLCPTCRKRLSPRHDIHPIFL